MRTFAGLLLVLLLPVCVCVAESRSDEPFGMVAIKAPDGPLWDKWQRLRSDIRVQLPHQAQCLAEPARCNAAERLLRDVVIEAEAKQGRARIEIANARINAAIRYTSDEQQWKVADAWSAPLWFDGATQEGSLDTGVGDCEDYAIAKYVVLRLAGVAAADLRVVLLHDNAVRLDHAVTAVRDGPWLILDNRWNRLFEARDLEKRFKPLFALDADGVTVLAKPFRMNDKIEATGRRR
jgi:predicted transglutaminase-like cysteine proteinase